MNRGSAPGICCVGDVDAFIFSEAEYDAAYARNLAGDVESFSGVVGDAR